MIEGPKEPDLFDEAFSDPFPTERPTSPGTSSLDADEERPTVSPPFDLEAFAKRNGSGATDAKRGRLNEASTRPPPVPTIPVDFELPEGAAPSMPGLTMRPRQITLTDPDELENARLKSVLLPSEPPPRRGNRPSMREDLHVAPPPAVQYADLEERDPFPAPPTVTSPTIMGATAAPVKVAMPAMQGSTGAPMKASALAMQGAPAPDAVAAALALALREMRDRISFGDYTGGLETAERILQKTPGHAEATRGAAECRAKLAHMYAARIGPMHRVPYVTVPREQLRWLSIDHRAGFLLSHVDGTSSLEMILDVSGMAQLDALRILCELVQQRVIAFR